MHESTQRPIIFVSVMVNKGHTTLLNFRKGSFAADCYGVPGGKLDNMETFQQCAERECLEEAGIKIGSVRFVCLINNRLHDPHHFMNVGVVADWVSGEPEVREPEKCAGWGWYDLDHLPEPMTEVSRCIARALTSGQNFFEIG